MTKFIIGKAYSGVSAKVMSSAAESLCSGARVIYIVPDQFEYETEKAAYRAIQKAGAGKNSELFSVRTFSSLSEEIIRLCSETRLPADDIMKSIIMHRVIKQNKNLLRAFGASAEKAGFCSKMVQTITMLKTAGITPQDLSEEAIEKKLSEASEGARGIKSNSMVADKLRDVGLLYLAYNSRLSASFLDKLDYTQTAAEKLSEQAVDIFDDADVFVDGFNDFTNSQLHFLGNVFMLAQNVTLGFCAENHDDDSERANVFLTINSQISRLKEQAQAAAEANYTEPPQVVFLDEASEHSPALIQLSDGLFGGNKPDCGFDGALDVVKAADIYEELEFTAAKIKQLTAEQGYRYSDIAVLCANPAQYKSCVKTAFGRYDIPYFADIPEPILYQPMINLVSALLKVLCEFTADNVLSYLKTGFLQKHSEKRGEFSVITKTEINAFESYLYEWAVSSEALKKPFTPPEGLDEREKKSVERAEEVRAAVVPPLLALRRQLEGKNGDEVTALIYDFLRDEIGIERAINYRIKNDLTDSNGKNDSGLVRSYQRLWDTLSGIFDKLYAGLSGDYISLKDYAQMFRDICAGTTLAKPPQFIDTVLVGDIDRTRMGNVRAVFIVGALEEAFPSQTISEGVFSPYETELIRESITHITENSKKEYCLKSAKEQYCLSLYRAYRAVSQPTDYLCLSWHDITPAGGEGHPSEVISDVLSLSGKERPLSAGALGEGFYCRSVKAAKQRFAAGMWNDNSQHRAVRQALSKLGEGEFAEKLEGLRAKRISGEQRTISRRAAELLFPQNLSSTKVEALGKCRFNFFCETGLGITQPSQRTFNRLQRGNVVHYVMEQILRRYSARMGEFFSLTRRQIMRLVKTELSEYRAKQFSADFAEDKRVGYLFDNIAVITTDMLIMTQAEFFGRDYRPKFFELKLTDTDTIHVIPEAEETGELPKPPSAVLSESGDESVPESEFESEKGSAVLNVRPLELDIDGRTIRITGIIDRVDMFTDKSGQRYLRVVDYKTNTHDFSIPKALNGINIQMLLYLFALEDANSGGNILSGSVSYTPAKVRGAKDKIAPFRFLAEQHRQRGMLISDEATLGEARKYAQSIVDEIRRECGDSEEAVCAIEEYMPAQNNIIPREGYEQLRADALGKVKANISAVYGGDVSALPLKFKEEGAAKKPCAYCRFASVCGNVGDCITVDEKQDVSAYTGVQPEEKKTKKKKG